jgi:mlo protein
MKPTIFNERVAAALRNWHHTARKNLKQNKGSVTGTPMSSRPTTPSHHMSPVYLLRNYRSEADSLHTSPRKSNFDIERWETESRSPSHHHHPVGEGSSSYHHGRQTDQTNYIEYDVKEPTSSQVAPLPQMDRLEHQIDIGPPKDFSFDKRTSL